DSAISNAMIVAALKSGSDSEAVNALVEALRHSGKTALAVYGESDAVTAATVERAMKRLQGFTPAGKLIFVGAKSYAENLRVEAEALGVPFDAIDTSK
ncbi:MAG: hypothetical protein ACTHL1_05325, partial [Burkholderiaceae bacterium]